MVTFQGHANGSGNLSGECGVAFQDALQASMHIQEHAQHGQHVPLMAHGLQYAQNIQLEHAHQPAIDFSGMGAAPAFGPSNSDFTQQRMTPGHPGGLFGLGSEQLPSPTDQTLGPHASPNLSGASLLPSASEAGQRLQNSPAPSGVSADSQTQAISDLMCQWEQGGSRCGKICGDEHELEMHVQAEHVDNMPKADGGYICAWAGCGRVHKPFAQKSKVKRHMLTHTQCKYRVRIEIHV